MSQIRQGSGRQISYVSPLDLNSQYIPTSPVSSSFVGLVGDLVGGPVSRLVSMVVIGLVGGVVISCNFRFIDGGPAGLLRGGLLPGLFELPATVVLSNLFNTITPNAMHSVSPTIPS